MIALASLGGQTRPTMSQNSNHRQMRGWIPATLILIALGTSAYLRLREIAFIEPVLLGIGVLTVLLLGLWYIFFTGLRQGTRWVLLLSGAGFLIGLYLVIDRFTRIDGSIGGSGIPRLAWKWTPQREGTARPLTLDSEGFFDSPACPNGLVQRGRFSPVPGPGSFRDTQRDCLGSGVEGRTAQSPLASADWPGMVGVRGVRP